jgi:hypothetical protein
MKRMFCFSNLFFELYRKKLQLDDEDMINFDNLEKQLANIQISINELEAWHTRTSNSRKKNEKNCFISFFF